MDQENNWDLQAVVRSCHFSAKEAAQKDPFSSLLPPLPPLPATKEEKVLGFEGDVLLDFSSVKDDSHSTTNTTNFNGLEELEGLCKSFFPQNLHKNESKLQPQPLTISGQLPTQHRMRPQNRPPSQTPRSKRRKNQQKKTVCQVPIDRAASADVWAWRKYGQKPIKGSPYPRGYYKCSSLKGCLARKQVERSCTDPAMLVITYTAEHNHPAPTHRNSLAGTTRHVSASPPAQPSSSPKKEDEKVIIEEEEKSMEGFEEELEEDEEEEGMIKVEDMELLGEEDLLIMGLEEEANGDGLISNSNEPFVNPSWLVN